MDERAVRDFLRRQNEILQEEKAAALSALDLARNLGTFSSASNWQFSLDDLLADICQRAQRMISFEWVGIYLVDEETQDIALSYCLPQQAEEKIEFEVNALIADQSFAYALQSELPVFFLDSKYTNHLLLHPLATPYRTRGMFVGRLVGSKEDVLDTSLLLFSVVMHSAASAIENLETNQFMKKHTAELERKVQERTQELSDAYDRINTALNGMQAGVMLIDAESFTVVDANPMALKLLGTTWEEIVGKQCFDYICKTEKGSCPIVDLGKEENSTEYIIERADGRRIPIHKTVSKVVIGGKLHLVENFIDITEQKRLEELKEHVERMMHHDLKNPLNAMINFPDLLLMDSNLTDQQRELVEYIKSSGYKLLNMINSSLDLYKMETGTYRYSPSPVNIAPVLKSIQNDQGDVIVAKNLKVCILYDGHEVEEGCRVMLLCEEFLLYSLLANLFKNAVEASPQGGEISFQVQPQEESTLLRIQNQGSVPESIRDSFFDKYVTSGKIGGTGLGTYSAWLIVKTMGGIISLDSSREGIAEINMELPGKAELEC